MQNMRKSHIDIELSCLKYREKNYCDVVFRNIGKKTDPSFSISTATVHASLSTPVNAIHSNINLSIFQSVIFDNLSRKDPGKTAS